MKIITPIYNCIQLVFTRSWC